MQKNTVKKSKFLMLCLTIVALLVSTLFLIGCNGGPPSDPSDEVENPSIWYAGNSIEFKWDAVLYATSYEIYHSQSRLGEKTLLGTTSDTTYRHNSPNAIKYENYYTIVPKTSSGNTIAGIRWNKIDSAVKYQVLRKIGDGDFTILGETEELQYVDTSASFALGEAEYRIDPINSSGNVIIGAFDLDNIPPAGVSANNRGRSTTRNIVVSQVYPIIKSFEREMFGANTYFYDAKHDSMEDIEKEINSIADAMRSSVNDVQMSSERYSFYFKPGTYEFDNRIDVGFYMTVAGLGITPVGTRIGTTIFTPPALAYSNNNGSNGTHNFWRSIENFEIYRPEGAGSVTLGWSVSQAAPMRRISVAEGVSTNLNMNGSGGWVSGGFAADIRYGGSVNGGGQQQWYTRNSHFESSAMEGVGWNNFAIASTGRAFVDNHMTTGGKTWVADPIEQMKEKPFLYYDTNINDYKVFVPALRNNALGVSWTDDNPGVGRSEDIDDFYFAKPGDTAAKINSKLDAGKHIFYTPGFYECEVPVYVKKANTVVLGTGMPTLYPAQSNTEGAMLISDVSGVTLASMFIDAHFSSKYLLRVGEIGSNNDHSDNPTFISDVFLRVGGYKTTPVHAEVSVHINSNNVIGDHFWVWRADHGRGSDRWENHKAPFGLIVHGDNVTMHGLFVEHYQKYQTLWLGEGGQVFFYQNESPYDSPNQEAYMNGDVLGWAAFKVSNDVEEFFAIGMGCYGVFNRYPIRLNNAIQVPNREGVRIEAIYVNEIGSAGGSTLNAINGTGGAATNSGGVRVAAFENGIATLYRNGTTQLDYNGVNNPDDNYTVLLAGVMN